ncbi:MAG TPA: phage baseplate assembly protein V [Longimicrobium sp.]|nr:phage baseplate assembly protein V [Longimicrobium sp.]
MSDQDLGPACRAPDPPGAPPVYWGKYRGRVESNLDPELMGRIQVSCPAVPGLRLGWAMPCVPFAGPGVGWFAIPPIGADVWVEFEGGDPNYPIWAGCFWQAGRIPVSDGDPAVKAFVTTSCRMEMNDLVETGGGWSVAVDLAAGALAAVEEAQSVADAASDLGILAVDEAADMAGAIGAAAAGVAADAVGDAEAAASDAEFVASKVEEGEDEIADEVGEVPGVYSIVISLTGITLAAPIAEIKMMPETIVMTVPESVLTLTPADMTLTVPESVITLTPGQIIATCPPGVVAIGPEAVTLSIADTNQVLSEPGIEIEAPTTSITSIFEVEGNSSFTGLVEVEGNTTLTGALEIDGAFVQIAAPAVGIASGTIVAALDLNVAGVITMDGVPVMVVP